ncbi:MAG: hypothetical protein JKY65_33525 [Planctomycetes bacterium]|nr:hypothetical protein [Planctomycetota bacterium]
METAELELSKSSPLSLLKVTLSLLIKGTAHAIPCSQVKRINLDLQSWGFSAEVEFYTSPHRNEDKLFTPFCSAELIEVTLSLENDRGSVDPIAVSGIVTDKEFVEQCEASLSGQPIMHRRYRIKFADVAQVLWGQHYPTELHVDTKLKTVIDAQKGAKIKITYDWAAEIDKERALVFLPLGGASNTASFYEFVSWYVDTRLGVMSYDSQTGAYKLSATKDASGTATSLPFTEVGPVRLEFPQTPRASAVVLNSSIEIAAKKEATANANEVAGVRNDLLVREPTQAVVNAQATLEGKRLAARKHEVRVEFALFPTISVLPGRLVKFPTKTFGSKVYSANETYRIRGLRVRADNAEPDPSAEDTAAQPFATALELHLELKDEAWVALPPYRAPRWPTLVEGLIVSEQGEETDETWQTYADSTTSLDHYKVKVPLYKNSLVFAPFDPNGLPGHLFFPAYKGAKVLLAFQLFSVSIARFLDWRAGAQLPVDGQGNHILVGKTLTSKTSLSHDYVEQSPVFQMSRLNDKDTQLIEFKDGTITIRTKEED